MLIIRFAALCILMVFSPLMFLGWVFPGLSSISRSYMSQFLGRAFFAPAYLMLIYLSAFIMGSYNKSASDFAAAFAGNDPAATAASMGPFLLICVFLIASVVVAGKMSTTGASTTISIGRNIQGRAQRVVKNTAAGTGRFAARNTVGRGARVVSDASERTRRSLDRSLSTRAQGNAFNRAIARGLDRTVGATLRASENASVAGSETKAQQRKRIEEQQQKFNTTAQETTRSTELAAALAVAQANRPDESKSADEQKAAREARAEALNTISNQVRRMGDNEVLNLDQETLASPEFAQHLTDSHIKALRESGKYTNEQARTISTTRDTGMIDTTSEALNSTNASAEELSNALDQLTQNIQSMPVERLSGMDVNTLTNQRVASNLTETQLEGMKNSGRFTASQITQIRTSRETGLAAIANGNAPGIVNGTNPDRGDVLRSRGGRLFQGSAQAAGQLPVSVYTAQNSASLITPSALSQRVRNGLSEIDAQAIQANIQNYLDRAGSARERNAWSKWTETSTEGSRFNFTVEYD